MCRGSDPWRSCSRSIRDFPPAYQNPACATAHWPWRTDTSRNVATTSVAVSEHPWLAAALPRPGSPLVMRAADRRSACAQPVKASESRCSEASFPEMEMSSFALSAPPPRRASLRAFLAVHHQTGIDSVELTLVGLLRHSKRFFGLFESRPPEQFPMP